MKNPLAKHTLMIVALMATLGLSAATDTASLLREVAEARAKGGGTITLSDGLYTFETPWKLGAEDKNLVFEAAPGAVPVISAGRRIANWQVGKDGWWRARVPRGETFSQFFVNGQRRLRPCWPRTGYRYVKARADESFRKEREAICIALEDWPTGENPGLEFCMIKAWTLLRAKIHSYEAASGRLTLDAPPMGTEYVIDNRCWYRFENVKSALGEAGDWYLDEAAGELTYVPKPGETPANCVAVASRYQQALTVKGASDVVFRGIVFSHGNGRLCDFKNFRITQAAAWDTGTVQVEGARGIRFEDCAFLHTGAYGLVFTRGAQDCSADRCEFSDLGAGGVRIGEGPDKSNIANEGITSGCAVRNCLIEKGGRFEPAGVGVVICRARNNHVANNTIDDLYYSGISCGWSWSYEPTAHGNIIERNDINHIGQRVLSDMGGIYTLGLQPGSVVRGNRIQNVTSARYGAFGMYQDSGSSQLSISNNFVSCCADTSLFQAEHSAENRIENNLFFDACRRQIYVWTIPQGRRPPTRIAGNIVKWRKEMFAPLSKSAGFVSTNNAYVCDDAGLPPKDGARGFTRCRDLEEAKRCVGFKPFPLSGWGWNGTRRFTANMPEVPAVFPPAPRRPQSPGFSENLATARVGDNFPRFLNSFEDKPEAIRVIEDATAPGGRSVEFTQSLHLWRPHIYQNFLRESGVVRFAFSIKLQKGAATTFEVRDGQYHADVTGPIVSFVGGGKMVGRGGALMDVPADVWMKVGLELELGEEGAEHTYAVRVKLPGDEKPRVFDKIPISRLFTSVGWFGFTSEAHGGQKFWLGDFSVKP